MHSNFFILKDELDTTTFYKSLSNPTFYIHSDKK